MSKYWWTCLRRSPTIFSPLFLLVEEVGRWGEWSPLDPLGVWKPSPYPDYSLWSSERDINLTLRLWAVICLWETRSAAQLTVPILQIPLTVGVHTNTHTHMPYTEEHMLLSAASRVPGISIWKGVCIAALWLRGPLKLCQQLSANSTIRHDDCLGWTTLVTVM